MKRFAETDKTTAVTPVITKPTQVPDHVRQHPRRDKPRDDNRRGYSQKCIKYHPNHHPLITLGVEFYLVSKILQYFTPSIFIF